MMLVSRRGSSSDSGFLIGSAITSSSISDSNGPGLGRQVSAVGLDAPKVSLHVLRRAALGVRGIARAIEDFAGRGPVLAAHLGGGPFDPLEDLVIAGAAAEVARERLAHL